MPSPIGSVAAAATQGIGALSNAPPIPAAPEAPSGPGFGDKIMGAVDRLQQTQAASDALSVQAATGELTDVHDLMIASTQAQVTMELTVAVRNKAVEAFNEIMRMPI
jgi:flagellar hook-basal body complex protein FliE